MSKTPLTTLLFIVLSVSFLMACAGGSNIQSSKKDIESIKSISIDAEVVVPALPYVQGINMNKYSWFGGIGAVAGANKDSMLFQEYLEKNGIKISEIALNSFKTALAQKGMFNISEDSPTKLKITVNTYGFGAAGAFDKENVKPLINITAALSKHDDNILWKKTDYVTNLSSKLTKYPFEQLAKDPSLVKISLAEASDIVIESILNDFK